MSDKQMWKDFFFDPITGVGNGIVLEDGSKIGLEFHMEDAAVLTASEGQLMTTQPVSPYHPTLGSSTGMTVIHPRADWAHLVSMCRSAQA